MEVRQQKTQETISLGIKKAEPTPHGTLVVKELTKFGSALKSGVAAGDEILVLNGVRVPTLAEADALAQRFPAGTVLPLTVLRAGNQVNLSVTLKAKKSLDVDIDDVGEVLERKISP